MLSKVSCGVIIYQNNKLLMCRVTGQGFWDLPKGCKENGELAIDAAIRELYEETSIIINSDVLKDLGEIDYNSHKRLHLFIYTGSEVFDTSSLSCLSTFVDKKTGQERLEVDKFEFVDFEEALKRCASSMNSVLKKFRAVIEEDKNLKTHNALTCIQNIL